jgi:hypothetical protein
VSNLMLDQKRLALTRFGYQYMGQNKMEKKSGVPLRVSMDV